MDGIDAGAVHAGDRDAVLEAISRQASEIRQHEHGAVAATASVTCPCGAEVGLATDAYKCRYCDVFFCPHCADDHFGEAPS